MDHPPTPQQPTHLEPSPLGTKEYWDDLYATEIANHAVDQSDEGTIWFDDSSAEDKVVEFLNKRVGERVSGEEGGILLGKGVSRESCSVLDLGMGNGHFLLRLREGEDQNEDEDGEEVGEDGEGHRDTKWRGRMLGVDYSQKSVEFARRIAEEQGLGKNAPLERRVEFEWWDVMTQDPSPSILNSDVGGTQTPRWDIVHDKGTFDAISLSEEKDAQGRRICEGYRERVVPLMREGAILVITSCNWTEEELDGWFLVEGGELERVERIAYRSFRFGGREGQTVCSVCYRRTRR